LYRIGRSDEVRDVVGHLFDLRLVECLNVAHVLHVALCDEINAYTLSAEAPRTADTVNVIFSVCGKVVVDDKGDLLHVDASCEQVRCDEHSGGSRAELPHDEVSLALVHVAVHGRHREVLCLHLLREPVNFPPRVAVYDSLGDGQRGVQVAQGLELPLLALDGNVKLFNTFEGELVLLDEDAHGVAHELSRDLEHFKRHGRGEDGALDRLRAVLEHIVDLVLEPSRQHFIGFIENEQLR
jgi:hypothetical protein